ncbi:hypothetical protein EJ08DRAFT_491384 [Tothia fuscella]|uniref:RING-type domain-containing protein n=1 Tax=Tothia fuscella TaxID=1048955 RepID=A0A9P4NHE3_9PEZI|nr:hypothetical protein EJ08DRAFT_491384 [Tothia fuscella]
MLALGQPLPLPTLDEFVRDLRPVRADAVPQDRRECAICLGDFDDEEHQPYSLGCGHYMGTGCLRGSLTTNDNNGNIRNQCINCQRENFQAPRRDRLVAYENRRENRR